MVRAGLVGAVALLLAAAQAAEAASPERIAKTNRAAWRTECSMCHMAYPAGLLPAASWRHIMETLERHFGQNARLDMPWRRAITAYLLANAADAGARGPTGKGPPPKPDTPLRITRFPWFIAAHKITGGTDDDTGARKSMSNCPACHRGALRGVFARDG